MEERLRHAPCGFLSLDHEGNIVEINDTFLNEMGYQREQLLGQHVEYLCKSAAKMIFHSYFYPNISLYGYVKELFVKLKNHKNEEIPFLMNGRQFQQTESYVIDIILLPMKRRMEYEQELRQTKQQLEEILEEKEAVLTQLEHIYEEIQVKQLALTEINTNLVLLSNTDNLTGIPNRKFFQEKLEELVEDYLEKGKIFSLLMIDIDHFKQVNDNYGHQIGDQVLVKVATILRDYAQGECLATRYGGEEFVVLLPGTLEEDASEMAKKVNQLIEKTFWKEVGSLTISVGVATFNDEDDKISILRKADQALYFSKENGRNQVTHYNEVFG